MTTKGKPKKRKLASTMFTLLAAALVLGALLAGCGSSGEESGSAPEEPPAPKTVPAKAQDPPPEEPGGEGRTPATIRLSGSPGTVFAGDYGNLDGSEYVEGVLEGEPIDYKVEVRDSGFDVVNASFVKPQPEGSLAVEILVDGEVVTQSNSDAQYGALNISWGFGG